MAKVLIVEDEPLVARMYQKSLTFDGFTVELAMGGMDGIRKAKSTNPDFILLDVMMPDPNGMQVLETIKKDPDTSHIPVVMLTNLSGKHDAELALQKGAEDYWVKKESKPGELGKKIRNMLEGKNDNASDA